MKNRILLLIAVLMMMFSCNNAKNTDSPNSENSAYRRGLTMITPASQWREAFPSGNGTIGAMVYGTIGTERILFNHNKLWYGGHISKIPDMSADLPIVRKLLLDGRYKEAHEHYRREMIKRGFDGRHADYHPAFDIIS